MKYKLDFSANLTNFKGEEVMPVQKLSEVLANQLSYAQTQDYKKFGIFAYDLYKTGVLELDKADHDLLLKWIQSNNSFVAMLKCALEAVFDNKVEVE